MNTRHIANFFISVLVPFAKNKWGKEWDMALHSYLPTQGYSKRGLGLSQEQARQILGYGYVAANWFEGFVANAERMGEIK